MQAKHKLINQTSLRRSDINCLNFLTINTSCQQIDLLEKKLPCQCSIWIRHFVLISACYYRIIVVRLVIVVELKRQHSAKIFPFIDHSGHLSCTDLKNIYPGEGVQVVILFAGWGGGSRPYFDDFIIQWKFNKLKFSRWV